MEHPDISMQLCKPDPTITTVAYDESYIDEEGFRAFRERIFEAIRMVNGYIKYLKQRKGDNSST